ncbi:MAG: glycosyltransferase family 4 protein [Pseudomonadota bacterium]
MEILFLSHYFPPEVNAPATRTYEHCKAWVRQGHNVTVVSCVPHHPMGRTYPGYRNRLYQVETKDGIRAIKVLTYITANEGFVRRTFNYIFYLIMAICIAPFLSRADVVISTSPQFFNGLTGYFVSRMKRAPWVLEIRDLWPESIVAVGAVRNTWIIRVLERIERFAYRKADWTVAVTNAFKDHIVRNGGDKNRVSLVRNGVDLRQFTPRPRDEAFKRELGMEGKFIASYVGTHGMAHGLDTVLEAADLLRTRPDIGFLMVGDGAERDRLEKKAQERDLQNLKMLGQLSKESMPTVWSATDVSLVLLKRLDLFKTVIPSKIFESMAMRRPLILGVEGECKTLIEEAGAGYCIEPENAQELASAIIRLADDPGVYSQIQEAGSKLVALQFDRNELALEYLKIIERVISERC